MIDRNHGIIIEGFVQVSYNFIFGKDKIEVRHSPLTSWSQATVSGCQSNFETTKGNVINVFKAVQQTLHKADGNDDLLNEFGNLESCLQETQDVTELGNLIAEARPILDKALAC